MLFPTEQAVNTLWDGILSNIWQKQGCTTSLFIMEVACQEQWVKAKVFHC